MEGTSFYAYSFAKGGQWSVKFAILLSSESTANPMTEILLLSTERYNQNRPTGSLGIS